VQCISRTRHGAVISRNGVKTNCLISKQSLAALELTQIAVENATKSERVDEQ
jgi:hypothetical protein